MKNKTFLIIDANSILYRTFYALPPLNTKKGELVNAVYGFLLVFLKTIKEIKPDFIVACFDLPKPTFRHKKFKKYKAQRRPMPDGLYQQIIKTKELLSVFSVNIFEKQGFEADDLVGTITNKIQQNKESEEIEIIILSSDKDLLQLINKNVNVFTPQKGIKDYILYNKEEFKKRFGLEPFQLIDLKALQGDSSDNIPGVKGIGKKTANELIKNFGTLEGVYENIDLIPHKTAEKLLQYKEQALFSKELVEIKKDVPIDFNIDKCFWINYNKEKAADFLRSLNFYSLVDRLP